MKHKVIFGWLLCCAVFSSIPANASPGSDNAPVDLQADSLTHDETGQEIVPEPRQRATLRRIVGRHGDPFRTEPSRPNIG